MRVCHLAKWVVASFLLSILVACGGGSSGTGCASGGTDCDAGQTIDAMGTDGPLLDAVVRVLRLQEGLDGVGDSVLKNSERSSATDGLADGIELANGAGAGPFLLQVVADAATTDLTTGAAPVISQVYTIITAADLTQNPRLRFYATALTTLAIDRAKVLAGSNDASLVMAQLSAASVETLNTFGFGLDNATDIFHTSPILDGNTDEIAEQQATAAYRTALETFAEVVEQAATARGTTPQVIFDAIVADFKADGFIGNASSPSLDEQAVVTAANLVNASFLSNRFPSGVVNIEQLLDGETSVALAVDAAAGLASIVPQEPDFDGDGVANSQDDFDANDAASVDTDGDGMPDDFLPSCNSACQSGSNLTVDTDDDNDGTLDVNDDFSTNDAADTDSDGDGNPDAFLPSCDTACQANSGLIVDADADGDGVLDSADKCLVSDTFHTFINNPQLITDPSQTDNDNDGLGDICDDDIDGDGALNINDDAPEDNSVTKDVDGDLVDDVLGPDNCIDSSFVGGSDTFNLFAIEGTGLTRTFSTTVTQALNDPNQGDENGDNIGDICDADADGDGTPNAQDSFPFDPSTAGDADADGVGDSSDNCVDTSVGGLDTMNPGEPITNGDQTESDNDGTGDICDLDKDGDTIPNDLDAAETNDTASYHFDIFYTQQSSAASGFKLATASESVLRDSNSIVVVAGDNQLDLGSDGSNDNTYIVSSAYQTVENSLDFAGANFGAGATPVTNSRLLVNTDDTSTGVNYVEPDLDFSADSLTLYPWGISSFVGAGRPPLATVGSVLAGANEEQALTSLMYTDGLSDDADLNGSYGFVDLSVSYSSTTASALVTTQSRVYEMDFDGVGGATPALVSIEQLDAAVGDADGSITYSQPTLSPAGYSVSGTGAVTIAGTPLRAVADADGELITLSADNLRGYGVKLDVTATTAQLVAGSPYQLTGLFINPALDQLTAGTLEGATLSFADISGSIQATLSFGGSVISSSSYGSALPAVAADALSGSQTTDEVNRPITIINGRLSRIDFGVYTLGDEFPLSVELEGYFVAGPGKGLLLRYVDSAISAVGAGAGGATIEFYCGDPTGKQFVDPNTTPPTPLADPTGSFVCGFIEVGDAGVQTKVTDRARATVGVPQTYSTILGEANTTFPNGTGFGQGIIWGIPQ